MVSHSENQSHKGKDFIQGNRSADDKGGALYVMHNSCTKRTAKLVAYQTFLSKNSPERKTQERYRKIRKYNRKKNKGNCCDMQFLSALFLPEN